MRAHLAGFHRRRQRQRRNARRSDPSSATCYDPATTALALPRQA